MIDYKTEVYRIIQLLDGGELYNCGDLVIYGWPISGRSYPPTEDAIDLLKAMEKEIERLKAALSQLT
jgi:hypothetical protein